MVTSAELWTLRLEILLQFPVQIRYKNAHVSIAEQAVHDGISVVLLHFKGTFWERPLISLTEPISACIVADIYTFWRAHHGSFLLGQVKNPLDEISFLNVLRV